MRTSLRLEAPRTFYGKSMTGTSKLRRETFSEIGRLPHTRQVKHAACDRPNAALRGREYLTVAEVEKLIQAARMKMVGGHSDRNVPVAGEDWGFVSRAWSSSRTGSGCKFRVISAMHTPNKIDRW
jgi:hypothetical protein